MPSGAELFCDALERLGIGEIFTLVGDHLNEVLIEAARRRFRLVDFRHESGVTHAADAWARLQRRPALSLVTGGPGHTNSLTGVATASLASSPLIAVSGAPATPMAERVVFQEIDQVGMTRPVVKWAGVPPGAAQIPLYLARAFSEAVAGRMGPVHLTIPVDLFRARVEGAIPWPEPVPRTPPSPAAGDVERALAMLRTAERPVVIAGSGLWWADAGAGLERFLKRTRLACYSITMARGLVQDFGYADPAMNKAVLRAFQEADVCLVLGKRIDSRLALGGPRLFSPATKFIQVDIHPQELGRNRRLELGICADVKVTLQALVDALGKERWKARTAWISRQRAWRDEWRRELAAAAADTRPPLHPAAVHFEFGRLMPAPLYSWDGGDFAHWGRAILPALRPGGWLRLGPLATIGSALPNAIALQLASPREKVVLVTGDGALGFYIADLETLVRHNLPAIIIVGNDAGWGIERELQRALTGGATVACELRPTRYDLIMKGFGGDGETVERLGQLGPALKRAQASDKPYLINIVTRGARSPFTEWQIAGKK